jgi:palmitoyltransferase
MQSERTFHVNVAYFALTAGPFILQKLFLYYISNFVWITWMILLLSVVINYHLSVVTNPGFIEREIFEVPVQVCKYCERSKPPRAHHCRKCHKCVLRMDHHCLWISNCVGYFNQGHFTRLIISLTLFLLESLVLLIGYFWYGLYVHDHILVLLCWSVSMAFLLPLTTIVGLLLFNQIKMIITNQTTIEKLEYEEDLDMGLDPESKYDIGWYDNAKQILGENHYLWWLPQPMAGNGIKFEEERQFDI